MLRSLHLGLVFISVLGFLVRAGWAFAGSEMRAQRWVRIAPHVVDTALLLVGVFMAVMLGVSPVSGWLAAKLVGLVAYIGFGVLTLRAHTNGWRVLGFVGAMGSVSYVIAVALARNPWPF